MQPELVDHCRRYIEKYYEIARLYITIGDKSLTMSISDPKIKTRTHVELGIIESLATLLLEEGVERDVVASAIWENSRTKGDLADTLSLLLIKSRGQGVSQDAL